MGRGNLAGGQIERGEEVVLVPCRL